MKLLSLRKCFALVLLFGFAVSAQAVVMPPSSPWMPPVINQVSFDVTAEQWVSTKTAKVILAVNAGLTDEKLANAYGDITRKLQKLIGDAQWHITTFERSTDKSGLEQLYVTAEARLPESVLSGLKEKLKAISKAGETYTIASVDYTPTLAEYEAAESALRTQLYNQIKNELAQLNATYPNQKYNVHSITFMQGDALPVPGPMMMATMNKQAAPSAGSSGVAVSNSLQLKARVVLATPPTTITN